MMSYPHGRRSLDEGSRHGAFWGQETVMDARGLCVNRGSFVVARRAALLCGCALALLAASVPTEAFGACGMGNECAVVDGLSVSVTPVPATGRAIVTCQAHDPNGVITRLSFGASGGTFANGAATMDVSPATVAPSASGSTEWTPRA